MPRLRVPCVRPSLDDLSERMARAQVGPKQLGALGEQVAALWLQAHDCIMLDRNWRCRYGELDLIVLDPDGAIVFVEVKTRRGVRFGSPQEAVTGRKQVNLRRAGVQWLMEPEHRVAHRSVRFDVIAVLAPIGQAVRVTHIREAF
ncbi:YraN family protein [Bifidobacterium simiiventris]|uniref:YraN family protein n=2 Tax=Bifidobacterium TaxID=1678 RepID=UPI003B83776A